MVLLNAKHKVTLLQQVWVDLFPSVCMLTDKNA